MICGQHTLHKSTPPNNVLRSVVRLKTTKNRSFSLFSFPDFVVRIAGYYFFGPFRITTGPSATPDPALISQCSDLCRRRTRIVCECMGIVTVDSGGITTVRAIPTLSNHQVRCSWVACSVFRGAQSCAFWQVPYRRSPLLNTVCVSRLMRHAPCHMRALFRRSLWHSA